MKDVLAFDVYGTLIDTHGVVSLLKEIIGQDAKAFSEQWRQKQLEYTFRKGLMDDYQNFAVCTKQALEFTCEVTKQEISDQDKGQLLAAYQTLPSFEDVKAALPLLANHFQLFAFSNGATSSVRSLLTNAAIINEFTDIVSTDEIKTFKPNPAVYHHLLQRTNAEPTHCWLISSNPFDVIGAKNVGLKAAWIARSEQAAFDPWGIEPDIIAKDLNELAAKLTLY